MLDHIERGRVAEQPAREHLAPRQLVANRGALLDEHLDECAGFGRVFPRRGLLARRQLDDDVVDPQRLAGLELEIPGQVVARVEQTYGGDAFGERGHALLIDHPGRARRLCRTRLAHFGRKLRLLLAPGQGQREQRQRKGAKARLSHRGRAQSPGVHAS